MSWFIAVFTDVIDALSQWLVEAPIAVQMLVLTLTAVPALVAVAWVLMWGIDRLHLPWD